MSGLYNLVMGDGNEGTRGAVLLQMLDNPEPGRFRDAWVEKGSDGEPVIAIYTRNGGGNRESYEDVIAALQAHPLYLRDADDDFDSTYATFYFRVPAEHSEALKQIAQEPVDMSEEWLKLIANMNGQGA